MGVDISRIAVLLGYAIFLMGFGLFQGRKVKSGEDYMIASRMVPGWVAALSERATAESSWCLLGMPGVAYIGAFPVSGRLLEVLWALSFVGFFW